MILYSFDTHGIKKTMLFAEAQLPEIIESLSILQKSSHRKSVIKINSPGLDELIFLREIIFFRGVIIFFWVNYFLWDFFLFFAW